MQREKSNLQKQVQELDGSVDKLKLEKVLLEQQMEMEEENIVNRLQRQLDHVIHQYRTLERRMQARGLSPKDFGVQLLDQQCKPVLRRRSLRSHSFDSGGLQLSRRDIRTWSTDSAGAVH